MIEIIDSEAALAALAADWDALWAATPGTTPFQSPRWLLPWWRQFGTGLPRVAIVREAGALVGVLPLYILPAQAKALPIGAGTTDYLDALGAAAGLLEAALDRLARDGIATCDLIDIPPHSSLIGRQAPGWSATWHEGAVCPVLTLPDIPARARRKLAMNRNRADRAGGWSIEAADAATVQTHLDTLAALHQARWTAQGESGALADPRVLAFWRDAAPGLLDAGLLRLQTLRIGHSPAAAIAALLAPNRIFFYLSGFDAAHAFVSPGSILLGAMLDQAHAEGRRDVHFLRGQEAYKYAWGATDRRNQAGSYVASRFAAQTKSA